MMEISHCDEAKWYVAQVKPNGFASAEANLDRQGFETFMPLRRKTVRHARQMRDVLRPVFPGYLFIKFDLNAVIGAKSIQPLGSIN